MDMPTLSIPKKTEKSLDLSKVIMFGPPVAAVVVALLVAFLVVWPKYTQVEQLKVSNETLEENTLKLEEKAGKLAKINRDELKVQRSAAEKLLPSEKDIFVSLRQVESVRNSSGVIINSLSVGAIGQFSSGEGTQATDASAPPPPTPEAAAGATSADLGDVNAVTIKTTMSSDFDQIFSFLNALYALPRVTTVTALTFSIDQDGLINTSMDINSLWQQLPGEIASVEAPLPSLTAEELDLLKKVNEGSAVAAPVEVPDVPKGKTNIFAN